MKFLDVLGNSAASQTRPVGRSLEEAGADTLSNPNTPSPCPLQIPQKKAGVEFSLILSLTLSATDYRTGAMIDPKNHFSPFSLQTHMNTLPPANIWIKGSFGTAPYWALDSDTRGGDSWALDEQTIRLGGHVPCGLY